MRKKNKNMQTQLFLMGFNFDLKEANAVSQEFKKILS